MLKTTGWTLCEQVFGYVGEMFESWSEYNPLSNYRVAISRVGDKTCVSDFETLNVDRMRLNVLFLLEPGSIGEVEVERKWFDILSCLAQRMKKRFDSMNVQRIEMPVTCRTQIHTAWHVSAPKLHRLPNDQMFDSVVLHLRRQREPKWSCPDD
jgi:hypothetical protein